MTVRAALVWFVVICRLAPPGFAVQERHGDREERVQAWLEQTMNLREVIRSGDEGIRLDYIVEHRYVPPREEVESLRREIAGKPEHPQRARLAGIERRLRGEFPTTEYAIWLLGREFRCSMTQRGERGLALDSVIAGTGAWAMNPVSLHVADVPGALGIGFRSVESFEVELADALLLLNGGLDESRERGVALYLSKTEPGRWSAEGRADSSGTQTRIAASGAWDDFHGAGTVERVTITVDAEGVEKYTTLYSASGWRFEPAIGRMIAGEAERRFGLQVDRRVQLVSADAITTEEFRRATAVPKPDGVDVLRGPVTFRAVEDVRAGHTRRFAVAEDRDALVPSPGRTPAQARNELRTVGWVIAGCIVVALVLLRARSAHRVRCSGSVPNQS